MAVPAQGDIEMEKNADKQLTVPDDADQLVYNSVLETSRFFTSLVELLPAKFYLSQNDEEENIFNPKKMKKRKKKPIDKKFLAKKAKLFKLDPSQHKSITELQEEVEKKEKELQQNIPKTAPTKIQPISVSEVTSTQSLADLHEKLHAKMDQLRGNRKIPNKDDKSNDRKRKAIEKKTINKEKKKRKDESSNIKISTGIEKNAMNSTNSGVGGGGGDIVFSKFDFATKVERDTKPKKKKKDLKQLLEIAENKETKLKLLEETDAEKAKETKQSMSWDSALQKARGTKLKDNPKLLKKSIKRQEKAKSKSDKQWSDRVENVEKKKEEKQKLRKQHLKERREGSNKNKKGSSSGKKKKKPPKKHSPGF